MPIASTCTGDGRVRSPPGGLHPVRAMTGASDWRGRVGAVWADNWQRTDRAFAGIAAVLDAAVAAHAPTRGDALDIGCGAGATSLALAASRPTMTVTGCDLSPGLIAVAAARGRHADAACRFVCTDALDDAAMLAPLDLLVSRHGVMFFDEPVRAFARLRAAARPGAPVVFSAFGCRAANGWAAHVDATLGISRPIDAAQPGPFAFADSEYVAHILTASGWIDATLEAHIVPFVVGAGDDPVGDALAFYRRIGSAAALLADATDRECIDMEARLADMLARHVRDRAVTFEASVRVWTARAGEHR